jgi:murein DD-endopeptidase MepM/ murein hydrolase activator NlpD
VIHGQPIHAAARGRVIVALDGLPDSPPGALPPNLPIEQADGNHVVVAMGRRHFALYAHMQPGSVRVGQRVRRGQVLGLVGTSGNSSEPHLHFHVTDGPSPLASNGVERRAVPAASLRLHRARRVHRRLRGLLPV